MIITLLRKPLEGSVADNTLKHGCGAINIDICRIDSGSEVITTHSQSRKSAYEDKSIYGQFKGDMETHQTKGQEIGRWPANFILTHLDGCERQDGDWACVEGCPVKELDQQSGILKSGGRSSKYYADTNSDRAVYTWKGKNGVSKELKPSVGGASRFFKQFKKEDNQ